jgi:hypothetical protein
MEYRDFTPLETATFDTLDKEEREYHVVVMRGTFDIPEDGLLTLSEEQNPLVATDEYFGKTNFSSVRQESDFAPYKPKTDVILDATAYAPGGKPAKAFLTGVKITAAARPEKIICEKKLLIAGPTYWTPDLLDGWTIGKPEPMTSLPLRYEQAFGGMVTVYDPKTERDQTAFYDQNPIGVGYWPKWTHPEARRRKRIPAPRILPPETETITFGQEMIPQGYGSICRTWQPRLKLAGTYDEEWQAGRWPNLPEDFDFGYWNSAHPDLQVPFLNGDEEITLTNLTPDGKLRIILPGHVPFVLVRYEAGEIKEARAYLDTVFIEPEKKQVSLVWRTTVLTKPDVRVLEARMILRQDKEAMLREAARGLK